MTVLWRIIHPNEVNKMQSKKHSALESVMNVLVGYIVALLSQLLIFPFFDIHVSLQENMLIGFWFTVISLLRSYTIRRWFTRKTEAA